MGFPPVALNTTRTIKQLAVTSESDARYAFSLVHFKPLSVRFANLTLYLGLARSRRIERTLIILSQCKAHEDADRSCSWYGNHQAYQAEQIGKHVERENYPHGIKMYAPTHQVR